MNKLIDLPDQFNAPSDLAVGDRVRIHGKVFEVVTFSLQGTMNGRGFWRYMVHGEHDPEDRLAIYGPRA